MRSSTLAPDAEASTLKSIHGNVEQARSHLMEAMKGADLLGGGALHGHIGLSVVQLDDARALLTERTGS